MQNTTHVYHYGVCIIFERNNISIITIEILIYVVLFFWLFIIIWKPHRHSLRIILMQILTLTYNWHVFSSAYSIFREFNQPK